jgi:DNA-binding HxlR family transcriptional regulator
MVIIRTVYAEVPPRVEYSLTEFGRSLMPILFKMSEWGQELIDNADPAILFEKK